MKRIKEYMDSMTTQGWVTTAIIGALVIVILVGVFVGLAGKSDENRFSFKKDKKDVEIVDSKDSKTDKFINDAKDTIFVNDKPVVSDMSTSNTNTGSYVNSNTPVYTAPSVSYDAKKQEVQIALIIEENQYDVQNIIKGMCGNVYMVTAYVPGPAVLTNSYEALFGNKIFGDFLPGNIIPNYHPDLDFEEVVITNGVAKIYLTGKFNETTKNSCDTALAIAQLTETAKGYPNVKSVEIYLGSKKVN